MKTRAQGPWIVRRWLGDDVLAVLVMVNGWKLPRKLAVGETEVARCRKSWGY